MKVKLSHAETSKLRYLGKYEEYFDSKPERDFEELVRLGFAKKDIVYRITTNGRNAAQQIKGEQ